MNNELDRFTKRYEATISRSDRHYARHRPYSVSQYHSYSSAIDYADYQTYVDRVQMVDIVMPEDRLRDLLTLEERLHMLENVNKAATQIINEHTSEEKVRKNNPAVQKAYEKYKLLVEMTRT